MDIWLNAWSACKPVWRRDLDKTDRVIETQQALPFNSHFLCTVEPREYSLPWWRTCRQSRCASQSVLIWWSNHGCTQWNTGIKGPAWGGQGGAWGNISTRGTAFLAILWTKQPTEKPSRGCRERDGLVGQERNGEEREIRNGLGDDAERATLRIWSRNPEASKCQLWRNMMGMEGPPVSQQSVCFQLLIWDPGWNSSWEQWKVFSLPFLNFARSVQCYNGLLFFF